MSIEGIIQLFEAIWAQGRSGCEIQDTHLEKACFCLTKLEVMIFLFQVLNNTISIEMRSIILPLIPKLVSNSKQE